MRGKPENLKSRSGPKLAPMPAAEFRARLKELGWSQAHLADKLEKAPHTIGKWANGELHVPGYMRFVFELLCGISAAEKKLRDLHESD